MRRVLFYAVALMVLLGAVSVLPTDVASAAGATDTKSGPANVGPLSFPCGSSIIFPGFTTDGYHSEKVRGRTLYGLHSEFRGSHATLDGPVGRHVLQIQGDGVFGAPTGHDATGDFFDFHFNGTVTGPLHNYAVGGTWRVWVKRDHIVTDQVLTLALGNVIVSDLPGIQC